MFCQALEKTFFEVSFGAQKVYNLVWDLSGSESLKYDTSKKCEVVQMVMSWLKASSTAVLVMRDSFSLFFFNFHIEVVMLPSWWPTDGFLLLAFYVWPLCTSKLLALLPRLQMHKHNSADSEKSESFGWRCCCCLAEQWGGFLRNDHLRSPGPTNWSSNFSFH